MSTESTGTKICPHCYEPINNYILVCPHCGQSANERQTTSYTFSILEKRIQTEKPNESQKEEDSKPPDNKNSGGSGLGRFFIASLVFLVIALISYFLGKATYNEENPWGNTPFIYALVISVLIAVISGIIGIIMKITAKTRLGCFFATSLVFLAIAGISYLLATATYNEENPWGNTPFVFALVISVPIAVIAGIIGIIMKITEKKDKGDD